MSRYLRASVALASALAGAVLCTAPAIAAPSDDPVAGDNRATAHAGNVVAAGCAKLYPGSHDVTADLTKTDDGTYLDISAVADGVEVVGVIVKGGPAYNRYDVAALDALPWLDLHSPIVPSGKPAAISHWFACGTGKQTTTTPSTPPSTPPTSSPTSTPSSSVITTTTTTDSSVPASTTTTGPESSSAAVTTTTSADVAPVAQDDDLASTGFDGGWLVMLAAGLLLAGGAVLLLMRKRARS